MSIELTDAVVIGSGYGGAIPAYHLAAGGAKVVILERGGQFGAADFAQDMRMGSYTRYLDLVVGQGIAVFAGNCVGGGSVVNFAVALRAPSFAFERMGSSSARIWPKALSRKTLDPWYAVAEASIPVQKQTWSDVSYAGGVFAAACSHAGLTCNPVPVSVDQSKCVNCGWQMTGCQFNAKRSMLLNFLPAATAHGAQLRPLHEVQTIGYATTPGYKYSVAYNVTDGSGNLVSSSVIECRVVVLGAGALGTPVILQRSASALGGMPSAVGKYFSGNGDRMFTYSMDESKVASVLGLQRDANDAFEASFIGKSITAMTYDFQDASRAEFDRYGLQNVYFAPMTNILVAASQTAPTWFGVQKKLERQSWKSWLGVLAMVEDDNEGVFGPPPATGTYTRVTAGIAQNALAYQPNANTIRGFTGAQTQMTRIMNGLSTEGGGWSFDALGDATSHPLASARMGDNPATSALDSTNELRGHPGIFVTDGSAIPAALTVNPHLTISAVAERAVPYIIDRARGCGVSVQYGAPAPSGETAARNAVMSLPMVQRVLTNH